MKTLNLNMNTNLNTLVVNNTLCIRTSGSGKRFIKVRAK